MISVTAKVLNTCRTFNLPTSDPEQGKSRRLTEGSESGVLYKGPESDLRTTLYKGVSCKVFIVIMSQTRLKLIHKSQTRARASHLAKRKRVVRVVKKATDSKQTQALRCVAHGNDELPSTAGARKWMLESTSKSSYFFFFFF